MCHTRAIITGLDVNSREGQEKLAAYLRRVNVINETVSVDLLDWAGQGVLTVGSSQNRPLCAADVPIFHWSEEDQAVLEGEITSPPRRVDFLLFLYANCAVIDGKIVFPPASQSWQEFLDKFLQ